MFTLTFRVVDFITEYIHGSNIFDVKKAHKDADKGMGTCLLKFDHIPECDGSSKVVHQPLDNYM
jgi:hypothetical protein